MLTKIVFEGGSGSESRRGRRPGLRSATRAAANNRESLEPTFHLLRVLNESIRDLPPNQLVGEFPGVILPPELRDPPLEEPVAGPSGTQSAEDYRNILGDIDIPEGVDPSFLAALPEDMRQEVIAEHVR